MGRRGVWRCASGYVTQRIGSSVAALVLDRRRGATIHRSSGVDGGRGRASAVEALGDMVLVVDGSQHGSGAGAEGKGTRRREAVKGVGRACGCANHLAESKAGIGAVRLDRRALRGVSQEGRR